MYVHVCMCVPLTGPEPDQFSLNCWPYLATHEGFRAINEHWQAALPVSWQATQLV